MPSSTPALTLDDVREHVRSRCLPASTQDRVGIELEWLTVGPEPEGDVSLASLHEVAERVHPLPGDSLITFEPGGQLELSSRCHDSVGTACMAMVADTAVVREELGTLGIRLMGLGIDPYRVRPRLVHSPRYDAMEAFFDHDHPAGRTMMCSTAATQVNLDAGPHDVAARRWERALVFGPVLAAVFANSPIAAGAPTGWRSTRLATWSYIDASRTGPPCVGGDPVDEWTSYVLDARVMLLRQSTDQFATLDRPLTFRDWVCEGHEGGYPTADDLDYHISTLFPPVRARGWLELRMIDALPDPWWRVAVAITTALVYDEEAAARAIDAGRRTGRLWDAAARHGLSHPDLAAAARRCFAAALEALPRIGADPSTASAAVRFYERYVARGRCPADDVLEAWQHDPRLVAVGQ